MEEEQEEKEEIQEEDIDDESENEPVGNLQLCKDHLD
jgi:hypothetical protein